MLWMIQDRKRLLVMVAVLVAIVALVPAALAAPDSGPSAQLAEEEDNNIVALVPALVAFPLGRSRPVRGFQLDNCLQGNGGCGTD